LSDFGDAATLLTLKLVNNLPIMKKASKMIAGMKSRRKRMLIEKSTSKLIVKISSDKYPIEIMNQKISFIK
jgi:uncharacterized protein YggU (UPF0235/DUF167 family)